MRAPDKIDDITELIKVHGDNSEVIRYLSSAIEVAKTDTTRMNQFSELMYKLKREK